MAEARTPRVLVVDDDPQVREVLALTLEEEGHAVTSCGSAADALAALAEGTFDLVLTDLRMPGGDGIALLGDVRARLPELPVVLVTAHGGVDDAVEAVKAGADDFLQKPVSPEVLVARVRRVLEAACLRRRVRELEEGRVADAGLRSESPAMKAVLDRLPVIARSDCTILLRGETGTGKEVLARAIHDLSPRATQPFTAINCGGIPEDLFEAELFGHARGAFTGADRDRPGLIAETDGGTLFLDEVGDLPYAMQVKILRILEDGEVRQIGRGRSQRVDVRVVAATNVDLEKAVEARGFRQDLYYRLNTLEVFLPPLRDRPEDVAALAETFLEEIARKQGRPRQRLSAPALQRCRQHSWPGNVRELRNRLRAAALFAGPTIELDDLKLGGSQPGSSSQPGERRPSADASDHAPEPVDFRAARQRFERQFIEESLARCRGNVFRAAGETGISRRQLYDMMKALRIDPAAFRDRGGAASG